MAKRKRDSISRARRTNALAHKVFEDVVDNGRVYEYLEALIDGLDERGDVAGARKMEKLADSFAKWAHEGRH